MVLEVIDEEPKSLAKIRYDGSLDLEADIPSPIIFTFCVELSGSVTMVDKNLMGIRTNTVYFQHRQRRTYGRSGWRGMGRVDLGSSVSHLESKAQLAVRVGRQQDNTTMEDLRTAARLVGGMLGGDGEERWWELIPAKGLLSSG